MIHLTLHCNKRKWNVTEGRLIQSLNGLVEGLNTPLPFESVPLPAYWPDVLNKVNEAADNATKSVRIGYLHASMFRAELTTATKIDLYKKGVETDTLFATIYEKTPAPRGTEGVGSGQDAA